MTRRLPPSEIRKDPFHDSYVIIAPRRSLRPGADGVRLAKCVFCPDGLDRKNVLLAVGPSKRPRVTVIRNVFPAVSEDDRKAFGRQEVVIETPDHATPFERLSDGAIAEVLETFGRRVSAIAADGRMAYVQIFKNTSGAGASIAHAHSQIVALGFVPPHLAEKSRRVAEYREAHGGACPYCDMARVEAKGPRRVFSDRHVAVFTPYASKHNYELLVLPRRHASGVEQLTASERRSMAGALRKAVAFVVGRGLPYNFYCHRITGDDGLHFYFRITPRGSAWAGLEIGTGIIVNPVPPEDAAAEYRKAFAAG
ncbi:MAG TPA: DUF4921 family protein [Patescibacteria group bacterium]|nr:DUF4921 family protein [Patescibacteria group bacterium]